MDEVDRTIWTMVLFAFVENLRNLLTDQNYVQKYASCPTERDAKKSIWIAMGIFTPLTAVFVYIGTCLWAYYSGGTELQNAGIADKGDYIFPYYIATQLPPGMRGLIVAAIVAAAMSTISSCFNCAATVSLLDFYKRYFKPDLPDRSGIIFLRVMTFVWGFIGILCAADARGQERVGRLVEGLGHIRRSPGGAVLAGAAQDSCSFVAGTGGGNCQRLVHKLGNLRAGRLDDRGYKAL
jgi:Na+/proline symporter